MVGAARVFIDGSLPDSPLQRFSVIMGKTL
jgi:hypothetical protein